MSGVYRIPEGEFEAYLIPGVRGAFPRGLCRKRKRESRARRALERLHPGFGPSHAVDATGCTVMGKPWLLVTVMTAELLAEHRALAGNAKLAGIDGYFLDGEGNPSVEAPAGPDGQKVFLRGSARYVFSRGSPLPAMAAVALAAFAAVLGLTGSFGTGCGTAPLPSSEPPGPGAYPAGGNGEAEPRFRPDTLSLIDWIAGAVWETGGTLSILDLLPGDGRAAELAVGGVDPAAAMASLEREGILASGSLGAFSLSDNEARFALSYRFAESLAAPETADPTTVDAAGFFPVARSLVLASRGGMDGYGLAPHEAGWCLSLDVSVPSARSPAFLRDLAKGLGEKGLVAVSTRLSANRERDRLRMVFSLRKTGDGPSASGIDFTDLPRAFGFGRNGEPRKESARAERAAVPGAEWERLGSIASDSAGTVVYWRDKEGRIHGFAD